MDIKTELASNQIVLMVMPSVNYNADVIDVMKQLSGNICYITANKTYDALRESFEKNKVSVEKIVFIDTISKTMKKVPGHGDEVYYVSSPGALTELSLVIKKFLRHDFDYLIFDAITNLSTYQNKDMSAKFLADLVNKIKKSKTRSVFYAIESVDNEDVISKVSSAVDKVVGGSVAKPAGLRRRKLKTKKDV